MRLNSSFQFRLRRLFANILVALTLVNIGQSSEDAEDLLPVITEHPLDVIVAKGQPATLNCGAKGRDLQIIWYKDGEQVTTSKEEVNSHRLILQSGALFLLSVSSGKGGKDGDSGTYFCVARSKYGEARSREATLKIAMLRDDFRIRPRPVQAVVGNRAVLECSPPRGFPEPVVSWRKGENEIKPEDDDRIALHPGGNLIIDKVQRSDSGLYQCVAKNMVDEKKSSPARLSVYEKPYFLQEPHDVTAEVGSSVLFDCRVSGDPMPSISWKKRNQQMPIGRAYIAADNRGIRIDRIQPGDEGEYICQAKNPAGSIETSAYLRVHAPPSFTKTPLDVKIEAGEKAEFECEAEGQPTPALFWSREGQQDLLFPGHASQDGRVKVALTGELSISDVRPADEGNYVCAAMNAAGSSLAKAALEVRDKASSLTPPPIIVHGHSNQTLMLGSSAILPCQATGHTTPNISWLRNGELLNYEDASLKNRFTQLAIGSLQIFDLKKTDTAVYTCRARNEDGESTWTASLTVEEHTNAAVSFHRMPDILTFPSAPGIPIVQNFTEDSVELKWNPPEKNGAALIIGYLLQYFSPEMGQTWFNLPDYISGSNYVVKNLKSTQSYIFIVRAENSHGIGPPSPMSDLIRTKSKHPDGKEKISSDEDLEKVRQRMTKEPLLKLEDVKTINSSAVKVSWKKKRAEVLIQGYYIKWRALSSSARNSIDSSWINVTKANIESYIVNGLRSFTSYEFFVIPYYKNIQGVPSNSLDGSTDEAPPTAPPTDVRIRMMNLTTLRISWGPPSADGINGVLKGFQIVILGNGAKYNRNITTNERAGSVTLFHLVPGMTYGIKVAARSGAGVGVYHGLEPVTMNEATLREHIALLNSASTGDRFVHLIRRPWFIAIAGVFIWIIFVAVVAFVWWRWRKAQGKSSARLGMPFIKINDFNVHLTARDALWMDHNNLNTTQRSLLLHGSVNNGTTYNAPPLYTQTPHQTDFCFDGQPAVNLIGTIDRSHSPHHYHYAALTTGHPSAVSTFYASRHLMDDPSPYATTTLVMNDRQDWLKDHMLRCPTLPTNPVPSGPPPRFQDSVKEKKFDRTFVAIRSPSFVDSKQNCVYQSGSPPHTDTSYVQSSDGTGDSSNGRSKNSMTNLGQRSPPKQTILDFIPPPPPGAPPSETNNKKVMLDASEHYDAVSEALLFDQSSRYFQNQNNNHVNRHSNKPRANYRKDIVDYSARPIRDENSLKSSLMIDKSDHSSSDAGDDNSERDDNVSFTNRDDTRPTSECALSRPFQPCMGISASTLVQSDGASAKRSTGRLKSLPRSSKKDIV